MKNLVNLRSLVLAATLFSGIVAAQKISSNSVKTVVSGTSTLHEWSMTSTGGNFSGNVSGNSIQDVRYAMGSKTLKSGKGPMDANAYKALLADKYPNITFSASSVNLGKGTMTGKLTVTNVTKTVTVPVNVTKSGDTYTIWGTASIKMTDYGVTPPAFMMNTVKTGNEVKITVNAVAK
ncbi:Polyisoprenoid-binding protein YceI [Kaistella treverensis]|uniref:Polyisoprenoid-binding protein YceI n=1 Tax=Kaistella treverensis TaxID=631455 RepID=A0A1I3JSI3_9FLAO|nr:YceI family protein [Kaistella treverensis]SFI63144.1 Polyisoprenoid-binding protein YceI [Kaistella treverensis]